MRAVGRLRAATDPPVPPGRQSPGRAARLPRAARRAQLLLAAQEVFVSRGYHAAGMEEIAERAGVSKPVLYQHFPGKLELYLALLDQHADDLVAKVGVALGSTPDNRARVAACVAAYFDFVDGDGSDREGAFRLVFESDLTSEPAVRARVDRMTTACVEAIARTIAHDTGAGEQEAVLLSAGLVGLAQVAARWWLATGSDLDKQRAVDLLVGLIWRGVSGAPLAAAGTGGPAPGPPGGPGR